MIFLLSFSVGVMFAGGFYLLLQKDLVRNVLGLGLLGNSVNLALFTLGRGSNSVPPIIAESASSLGPEATDPVPQALILTAIVIGFGMMAYTAVLFLRGRPEFRSHQELEVGDRK